MNGAATGESTPAAASEVLTCFCWKLLTSRFKKVYRLPICSRCYGKEFEVLEK
jgi:hypothetical protein